MTLAVLEPLFISLLSILFRPPSVMLFPEYEKPSFTHIQTTRKLLVLYKQKYMMQEFVVSWNQLHMRNNMLYNIFRVGRCTTKTEQEQNMEAGKSCFLNYEIILKVQLMPKI